MKTRIKIDSAFLGCLIILTGFLFKFPALYAINFGLDQLLNFLGFALVLKGTFWRMVARGHKKAHSQEGRGLVMSGPYQYVRNPMYLGSFLLGCGFVFLVWPWWALPIFVVSFYWRFRRQIVKEEAYLTENFGDNFITYSRKVPRLFPKIWDIKISRIKQDFPLDQAWSTKERNSLFAWPVVALLSELLQQKIVFNYVSWQMTLGVFFCIMILASVKVWLIYKKF